MTVNEVENLVEGINSALTNKEGECLYNLAKRCSGKGVIVEIGSWKGKSTIWLAKGSQRGNNVKIYAIDPHTGNPEHKRKFGEVWTFDEFKDNIRKAQVEDIVVPIVKTSEEAVKDFDDPVELIFIDGNHDYDAVKLDYELWFPKVINGGIMAFHDTTWWEGPKRLVEQFVYKSQDFRRVTFVDDSITFAEKSTEVSLQDRFKNRCVLLLKKAYEVGAKLDLPMPIRRIGKKIVTLVQQR